MAEQEHGPLPEDEPLDGAEPEPDLDDGEEESDEEYVPLCEADFDPDNEHDRWFMSVFFAHRDEFDRQQAEWEAENGGAGGEDGAEPGEGRAA